MVQGLRRCQGIWSRDVCIGNQRPKYREFFSGVPVWKVEGKLYTKPWGYYRQLDPSCGAFYWAYEGKAVVDETGAKMWDTDALWAPENYESGAELDVDMQGQEIYGA
ncbi:Uncharacterized protein TPAR_05456 [Tolypocladium paradoxum]|uniref:Uncharacterized protein n=1 Tax=Tolypocladium paradoxum TaxID=94208 RepID=A0A2S4KVW2_9HYPO|nr:Uncharacterized protein TPAR_05456 [Tolypocladium paradoxum]